MTDAPPSRQAALFLHLVLGLQQSAMIALGKLMHPLSRKIEQHLDGARDTIDTLAALEDRTRGNLDADEARVLRQVLTELRMNYLDEVKKASGKVADDGGKAVGESVPSAPEVDAAEPGAGEAEK